jgi:hypothetical protein
MQNVQPNLGRNGDPQSQFRHPFTIRQNPATRGPLPLNAAGMCSSMLLTVKFNFTTTGESVRRETRLGLSVRVSSGKRSIIGQIVVFIQRRLALAKPDARSAQGNQCN